MCAQARACVCVCVCVCGRACVRACATGVDEKASEQRTEITALRLDTVPGKMIQDSEVSSLRYLLQDRVCACMHAHARVCVVGNLRESSANNHKVSCCLRQVSLPCLLASCKHRHAHTHAHRHTDTHTRTHRHTPGDSRN